MPRTNPEEAPTRTFLDDETRRKEYEQALKQATAELTEFREELDNCERLSEEDFVVRINAKD